MFYYHYLYGQFCTCHSVDALAIKSISMKSICNKKSPHSLPQIDSLFDRHHWKAAITLSWTISKIGVKRQQCHTSFELLFMLTLWLVGEDVYRQFRILSKIKTSSHTFLNARVQLWQKLYWSFWAILYVDVGLLKLARGGNVHNEQIIHTSFFL